jgi:hypothetical protein
MSGGESIANRGEKTYGIDKGRVREGERGRGGEWERGRN